jgi:hypothetical protein
MRDYIKMSNNNISKVDRIILNKLFKKLIVQGQYHQGNVEELYKMIREVCDFEFTEDNSATLDVFTKECFEKSLVEDN